VKAGSSYISTSDPRVHFGLADDSVMNKVEIRWPNGSVETLQNVSPTPFTPLSRGRV
jgi:hypothetical protein